MNLNFKKNIINSLLLAIGLILFQISPPILSVKPDFLLAMMFIIIILNQNYKTVLLVGIVSGLLTALTTNFPGGQLPNIIDKVITANLIYLFLIPLKNVANTQLKVILSSCIGTLLSGFIFLYSASILVGLPASAPISTLFIAAVVPAALINTIIAPIIYNLIKLSLKHSNINIFN